ncbi:MAG: O-antigen ligase family protein [Chloracidobacterium sp.]|nr:O-antigen ligase family protein [Chloracidobacterium sp.]
MVLRLSKYLFLLLVFSLPLVRPFNFTLFGLLVPYTDLIFVAAFGLWCIAVIRREKSPRFDRLFLFVGLYAAAFTISTILSVDPEKSFYKLLGEYYLFGLCFLTYDLANEPKFQKQVVIAWLAGTGVTALASIAGFVLFYAGFKTNFDNYFLSHLGSLPAGDYPRIHALFANANMLCNYINVSVVLILLAAHLGWIKKRMALILGAGTLFSALFSISPGLGGIALSVGLWVWAVAQKRWFARPALACGVVLAVLAFATTLVSPDTNNTAQEIPLPFIEKKLEPSVRVLVWQDTLQTVRQYPWFGKGTGMDVANTRYEVLSGMQQLLRDAHNNWLNILGQTGVFGLAAYMLLLIYLIKRCRFSISDGRDERYNHVALSLAFVGAFLYQGLGASFEDARHLWVLVGLLGAISTVLANAENDTSLASTKP